MSIDIYKLPGKQVVDLMWRVSLSNLHNKRLIGDDNFTHAIEGRWLLRKLFLKDVLPNYKEGFILDRINATKPIGPDNVKWVKLEDSRHSLLQNYKLPTFIHDMGNVVNKKTNKVLYKEGLYECFCGNKFRASIYDINYGKIKSCGCLKSFHNATKHALYSVYYDILRRCYDDSRKDYKHYGGKGILVCDSWLSFRNLIHDMGNGFKPGLSIDRIDASKGYCVDNCRWATKTTQARNTRVLKIGNTTGYRGVSYHKANGTFIAGITKDGKRVYIGSYPTALDAAKAYDKYVVDNNLEHTINGVYDATTDLEEHAKEASEEGIALLEFIWKVCYSMATRTNRVDSPYKTYAIDGEWLVKKNFIDDLKYGYQKGYVVKRIDDSLPISKHNVTWIKETTIDKGLLKEYQAPILMKDLQDGKGLYQCFCGEHFETRMGSIKQSKVKSCGCLKTFHDVAKLELYDTWKFMILRAYDKDSAYINEPVCVKWWDARTFNKDMLPTQREGYTLIRMDVSKGFCLDNCMWGTPSEAVTVNGSLRANNTTGYKGVTKRSNGKYQSGIGVDGKRIHLGNHDTAIEAAKAYNDYIIEQSLHYALNIIPEDEQ